MSIDRLTRVNELLRREIGQALYHVLKDYEVDFSAVTVTHVQTTSNLRTARVLVSIRSDEDSRIRMLSRLKKHRGDIQKFIHQNVVLKYTPRLLFELDGSVEQGAHVLDLLREIEPTIPVDDVGADDGLPASGEEEEPQG